MDTAGPCSRGAPRRGTRRAPCRVEPRSSRSASGARSPPAIKLVPAQVVLCKYQNTRAVMLEHRVVHQS
ncbi:putative ubiquitin-conjugating enzyme E2 25 [Zea mays]|uniref:Putative ubiquitin-conjugating enzyme E2 25 n=1 Tax=Zea mays TaxID=4577 RepID=A0A1D6MF02_MAIZE|nr:putative ubiquitin-conjugating enzyme E2 25 [Zea mays]